MVKDPVPVLLGPTAAGKTRLSLKLAENMGGVEIVSVDSMQVYRGMDIGTAKVSKEDRLRVPHHMIDIVGPQEHFDAARFCKMALSAIKKIKACGKKPLLVCGTPFYLKALLWGMFDGPGAQPQIRRRLRRESKEKGVEALHRRLKAVDSEAAQSINVNDYKRIERALEVYETTGKPISRLQGTFAGPPRIAAKILGLHWPRAELHERIEERVRIMVERGLFDEVRSIRDRLGPQARQAVGYKEVIACLEGKMGAEEAIKLIARNTRRLAKNQIGWFRKFPVDVWVERESNFSQTLAKCINVFEN